MKNFKRVISAVIALALSASTLVAVSASKFSDVDSTNSYAEAIESLAALDIVSGYEDGSFNPDGDITRAEAARMIVSALNMNADAAASAGDTQFADVNEKASWAKGFVNVGVAQGYIHGYDETSFGPQDKVTFAQMCVMLTTITGYGDYAAANGGYPTGYMSMASTAGINKGVALSAETPLKRGQVAQMVYNGVTAPMLDITTYKFDGNSYGKMDGTNNTTKKTLLSDKFDAIEVRATVSSFSGGKADITVTDSYNYGDITGATTTHNAQVYKTIVGTSANVTGIIVENDIDLSAYIKQDVKAILQLDSNNKTHLIYAEGTDAVETKEIEAAGQYGTTVAQTPAVTTALTSQQVKFGTNKETFENAVSVYVNGYEFNTTGAKFNATTTGATTGFVTTVGGKTLKAVLENAVGTIKIAKVPVGTPPTTPSNYNTILVDAYQIGKVSNVEYDNGKTTVNFTPNAKNIGNYTTISLLDNEIENGSVKLNVTLDGEAIELKDLKKGDVIAVKTKIITGNETINANDNKDVTILVSRETVSGKVTAIDTEDDANKFTVGGTDYAAVDKAIDLKLGTVYNVIYLDPFGRIAAYSDEEVEETHNYAIATKIDSGDVYFILADGTTKYYEPKDSTVLAAITKTVEAGATGAAATQYGPEQCVYEYTLKGGKLASATLQVLPGGAGAKSAYIDNTAVNGMDKYREDVSRIGVVGINSATNIIDASETYTNAPLGIYQAAAHKKYTSVAVNSLTNDEKYAGIGFGRISGTSIYSLVILADAGYAFSASSRFAVIDTAQWSQGPDADGDTVDQLKVLVNGQKTTLNFQKKFAPGGTSTFTPVRGTAIFYTVDSDGLVDYVKRITDTNIATNGAVTLAAAFGAGKFDPSKWGTTLVNGTDDYRLVQGIVVGVSDTKVRLADIPAGDDIAVDFGSYETLTLADDCLVYTYNKKAEENNNKLNATGSLQESDFSSWKIAVDPGSEQVANAAVTANGSYGSGDIGKTVWTKTTTVAASNLNTAYNGTNDDATAELFAAARGIKTSNATSIANKKTETSARYAMALVIDGQVVEIYEIIQ